MKFYGDTGDANSGSGSSSPTTLHISNSPADLPTVGGDKAAPANKDAGKGSFDFGDPIGSIGKSLAGAGDFLGGLGQIGIPGGPNLGGVAGAVTAPARVGLEAAGNALGAVGSIGFGDGANIGALPGIAADVIGAPGRFVEGEVAKDRLRAQQEGRTSLLGAIGSLNPFDTSAAAQGMARQLAFQNAGLDANGLPPEIVARLNAGESVDKIAEDMAKQGIGFSSDLGQNLISEIVFDPTNLLSFGAGKIRTVARAADRALQAGDQLGVGQRFMGTAYGAAARGLSAGGQALMDHAIGPTTSGVFHALGTRPYNAVKSAAATIAPQYGDAFSDAFARGAAQMPRAVIARYMAEEATSAIKRAAGRAAVAGEDITAATRRALGAQPQDIGGSIESRLSAIRTVNNDQIERRTEELLSRVTPDFAGHADEGRFIESRDKLAQITGMSPEDATRALRGKADVRTAQTIHLAFYGKAGDDLARAKAATLGAKNIDPERLTLISDDTLTSERAADLLAGKGDIVSAVDQYSVLRNRFGNTAFDHSKVTEFVQKLADEDALTHAVGSPTTGVNALPPALKDWQRNYERFGYDIGFAPKDGWKTIIDHETGDVLYADPFVHFTSEADALTQRNPLGRFMDSLFRGSTQTQIISDSRARMVAITRKGKISANEARSIHQRILQTAADEAVSPRGLALGPSHTYRDIFKEVLGDQRFAEFVQHVDPDFAVMKAFQGNLGRVGLTQAFTGAIKTATSGRGNVVAAISEGIYPALRFRFSPLFQAQEITESPFFNLLRGVSNRTVSKDVQEVYDELADLPDFKYLAEAGYTLNIAGAQEVGRTMTAQNTLLGKALSRFPNVKAFKERQRVAQVMYEHGPAFEEAVNSINPTLWRTMTEAYGTTDPRMIADAFIKERMALASGNMDEAMATFDAAKVHFDEAIQAAYDQGKIAVGQNLNVQAGVARGANGAGGAMKLTEAELARLNATPLSQSHDMETVWQAFRESFRQSSEQAFKTHYFNPTRSFFERTVNHPYLGIYPASYMWGKVLPEFARFLLKRPFGLNAPLAGINAYQRVQQTVVAALAQDPELAKWIEQSSKNGAIYLIDQMLPASPQNIPANAPAWTRHLSQDLASGKKIDPQAFVTREAKDTFSNAAGPLKSLNTVTGTLGDLNDNLGDIFSRLTDAASQLDGQFVPAR